MIGSEEKYPCRDMGNGKVRAVGSAIAMQGSSIAKVDVGGASIKLGEDGSYTLGRGATDMGTADPTARTLPFPMSRQGYFSSQPIISSALARHLSRVQLVTQGLPS